MYVAFEQFGVFKALYSCNRPPSKAVSRLYSKAIQTQKLDNSNGIIRHIAHVGSLDHSSPWYRMFTTFSFKLTWIYQSKRCMFCLLTVTYGVCCRRKGHVVAIKISSGGQTVDEPRDDRRPPVGNSQQTFSRDVKGGSMAQPTPGPYSTSVYTKLEYIYLSHKK